MGCEEWCNLACSKKVTFMELAKSFEESEIFVAMLHDVLKSCTVVSPRAVRLTCRKARSRIAREGLGFLTKALPRLGKALDRALLGDTLNCEGFKKIPNTQLPRFLGELFQRVLLPDGRVQPAPCLQSIASLRDILYCYYKYELPYSEEQEQEVLSSFKKTDCDLSRYNAPCPKRCSSDGLFDRQFAVGEACSRYVGCDFGFCAKAHPEFDQHSVTRRAQLLLERLFQSFNWKDIYPRHGPGAVSTKERGPGKWFWRSVSERLLSYYPLDEFFYVSLSEVVDSYEDIQKLEVKEDLARVVLVPKDSRGPRLISEEPLVFQWIQQGLRASLYQHIETHPLTRYAVHFTDQTPNQRGALLGSLPLHRYVNDAGLAKASRLRTGRYATLDLKEASDRVSIGLVRLLFPEHISNVLMACRSLGTVLPNGESLMLNKFAPMGSALCFPVLALAIWAILRGGGLDKDSLGEILVYGDDVIVPTAEAEYAIKLLEAYGLLVNRSKSCYHGFFRESCGVDAFCGHNVTPIRFRKVWTSARCPDTLAAWCSYENTLYKKGYRQASQLIADRLQAIYGCGIPHVSENLSCPSLASHTECNITRRYNVDFQRWERRCFTLVPRKEWCELPGWRSLLKYFSEKGQPPDSSATADAFRSRERYIDLQSYALNARTAQARVSMYTRRRSNKLCRKWLPEMASLRYDPVSQWWVTEKSTHPSGNEVPVSRAP